MNTEDFVTYKQALALKKLGFDSRVEYYYSEYTGLTRAAVPNNFNADCLIISAPTLAQAQKWLFKNKKHYVCPEWDIDKDLWVVEIKTKDELIEVMIDKNPFFNSYEEALSAGITECIKLLEK